MCTPVYMIEANRLAPCASSRERPPHMLFVRAAIGDVQHNEAGQCEAGRDALQHSKVAQLRQVPGRERLCCRAALDQQSHCCQLACAESNELPMILVTSAS